MNESTNVKPEADGVGPKALFSCGDESTELFCQEMESLGNSRFDCGKENEADALWYAAIIIRRHMALHFNHLLESLSDVGDGHSCTCICERCKKGKEVFLLPVDIAQIQCNALNWAMKHSPEQIEEMIKTISNKT